jgi:hypothetical protein
MPTIDGLNDLMRALEDLNRRVSTLESSRKRTITLGSYWRLEIQGDGAVSTLHAIRTTDGLDVQIAP